jgi:hypothetical protein
MATQNQDFRVKKGLVVQSTATFISTAQAVSTTTGAVQITGGAGIGGNLWVGGALNVAGGINASITGVITTATNLANGTPGQIPYQSSIGVTAFFGPGTAGQVQVSGGTGAPLYQNTLTLAGATGATSTGTGAFQVVGGVGIGENLYVGQNTVLGTTYNNTATGNKLTLKSVLQTATVSSVIDTTQNVVLAVPMSNWSIVSTDGNYIRNVFTKDTNNNFSIGVQNSSYWNDVNIYSGTGKNFNIYSGAAGIRSYIDSNGIHYITTSSSVSSTVTGALQTVGGIGIGGGGFFGGVVTATNVYVGPWSVATGTNFTIQYYGTSLGTVDTMNFATGTTATVVGRVVTIQALGAVTSLSAGTDTVVSTSTGVIVIWNTSTLQSITNRGATTTNIISITSTATSTSTNTGALIVTGGVGIGGSLNVNANSTFTNNLTINGTVTGGSIRTTSSATPPTSPAPVAGDIWYNTLTDDIYRYTSDGTNSYWLDITGPAVANAVGGTIANSQLTGSGAVTVTAGTGMSGGGSVALGSSVTMTNNGVVGLSAGTGMSVSGSAGGTFTITATGTTINSTSSAYVLVATDAGKTISITTGGVTIPNAVMSAGNIVSIYNNSGSSQTITQGASLTLQWAGQSTSQTGNRTLGLYGMCTILFITASSAVITGSGLT